MIKPLYIVSGLLDSGKTSLIKETLYNPRFNEGERTLILSFEDGEETYDDKFLSDTNSFVIYMDSITELTREKMIEIDNKYSFERVFIECNGIEDERILFSEERLIPNWEVAQILTTVDASMFKLQINNLKQFVFNHISITECAIFNRFGNDDDYLFIRNNIKAINPRVELIFEDNNHEVVEFDDVELFDLNQDIFDISDFNYGLLYMDDGDNPNKYENKNIRIKVKYLEEIKGYDTACIMGRDAMVCCADDIQPIGLTVIGIKTKEIKEDTYYSIEGTIHAIDDEDGYKTCVLYADKIVESLKPENELVYFN